MPSDLKHSDDTPPRLKLRAQDEQDVEVLAPCLQDALVPLCDMLYEPGEGRFALALNRFMWEIPPQPCEGSDSCWSRTHTVLTFHDVTDVRYRGIDRSDRHRPLALLTLIYQDGAILLEFAGGGAIRLGVSGIHIYLEDVGEPWPTFFLPQHPEE